MTDGTGAYQDYFAQVGQLLDEIAASEGERIEAAAQAVADCVARDGIVHVFGSGHSHMMAEEVFHRAGGLMAVNAMLDPNLTSFGTLNAGMVERTEGYAKVVLASFGVRPGEVVIVVSNSGINPVPIELAIEARALGATTIAVTSAAAYAGAASRHSSGQKLPEVADLVVDSRVPAGDAVVRIEGVEAAVGATSTALGAALMNAIVVEATARLRRAGVAPPVIVSMNVPGGDEQNRALTERYRPRLRLLKG
jgi:uncharacterized phosphosugar-binding protein